MESLGPPQALINPKFSRSLYSRNMAGLVLKVTNEYDALSEILSQLFEEDKSLDNYDPLFDK